MTASASLQLDNYMSAHAVTSTVSGNVITITSTHSTSATNALIRAATVCNYRPQLVSGTLKFYYNA